MKSHLFTSFDFFDFKSIERKQLDNIKNNFLYNIHLKFNMYKDDPSSLTKIISRNNNESIFYTGVETKAKESIKTTVNRIKSFIENLQKVNEGFLSNTLSEVNDFKIVKNKIGKDKGKSLLCCLVIIKIKEEFRLDKENNEMSQIYFLFPIKFGDFH